MIPSVKLPSQAVSYHVLEYGRSGVVDEDGVKTTSTANAEKRR